MRLMPHDKAIIRGKRRRPYGEIKRIAAEEGVSYHRLQRLCKRHPELTTRELSKVPPIDPAESGRKGGLRAAEARREEA